LHYYVNSVIFLSTLKPKFVKTGYRLPPLSTLPTPLVNKKHAARSVLAWPAWLRVLAAVPAVALLWLAVGWASLEAAPW
jgi:hypothetical protein